MKNTFAWKCRKCNAFYFESGEGLILGTNPSGQKLYSCPCGGIVDLTSVEVNDDGVIVKEHAQATLPPTN